MWEAFRRHYPYAALTMIVLPLLLGLPDLFIMGLALAIALLPCALGQDVDEIARKYRRSRDS